MAALQVEHTDDVREKFVGSPRIRGRPDEIHVAADAREVLRDRRKEAAGRVLIVVERAIGQRIAEQGSQDRAVGEFHADRERGFAVGITVAAVVQGSWSYTRLTNCFVGRAYAGPT